MLPLCGTVGPALRSRAPESQRNLIPLHGIILYHHSSVSHETSLSEHLVVAIECRISAIYFGIARHFTDSRTDSGCSAVALIPAVESIRLANQKGLSEPSTMARKHG